MRLMLTTDDGELLAEWTVEEEFGDLREQGPMTALVADLRDSYRRQKAQEENKPGDSGH